MIKKNNVNISTVPFRSLCFICSTIRFSFLFLFWLSNLSTMNDEGYSTKAPCTLSMLSMFYVDHSSFFFYLSIKIRICEYIHLLIKNDWSLPQGYEFGKTKLHCTTEIQVACHKWPRICSVCCNCNPFSFMTYHRVCNKSNMTGATFGTSSAYPPAFSWGSCLSHFSFLCNVL